MFGFGFNMNKQKSSQYSKPLGPGAVNDYYTAMADIVGREYKGEPTGEMAPFRSLTEEDYPRLEQNIYESAQNRLETDRNQRWKEFMAMQKARGVGDDPSAFQLGSETIDVPYTRAVADAANQAAMSRYQLQAQELGRGQEYDLAKYMYPREYWLKKGGLYYQGRGQESAGSSRGFGMGMNIGMQG